MDMVIPPFDELEDRILPWSQVKVICGVSRTTVWRMQKTGDFPACVQVSLNRVGWWQSELLAWKRSRTPRRLPEPRPIPQAEPKPVAPPSLVRGKVETPATPAQTEAADDRETAPQTGPRKRKSVIPENQTAFDFGA